jgi:hypothetical protein
MIIKDPWWVQLAGAIGAEGQKRGNPVREDRSPGWSATPGDQIRRSREA